MKNSLLRRARAGLVLLALVILRAADPQQQIAELRREIAHHDELYHRAAAPEISDFDYDQLKRRLAALEREFPAAARGAPPLREIGDDRTGLFPPVAHRAPMLSLDKAYTETETRAFVARVARALGRAESDLEFIVEPKFDGIAVSVTFERGRLVRAATRGNGAEGEDITAHVRAIPGLPGELARGAGAMLPELLELRGELYVPFAELARINAEREAAGEAPFANPRNLAAGTLHQRDPAEVARRGLGVVFYGLGACEPAAARPASQRELHARIAAWGLPGVAAETLRAARGADEAWRAIEAIGRARRAWPFPTDGAVVKLDDAALQQQLGNAESAPRWAVAFKFPPERVETQLRGITWQVGRTGVLTPVAELAPVALAGSTISRATLHNAAELARRDLRVGDTVFLEKAGEIIPAIVGVNLARRPAGAVAPAAPTRCPECSAPVASRAGEVALRCGNAACPAQLRRRLEHFASKAAMDIDGLGPAQIDALVRAGRVRELADLYQLRADDLRGGTAGRVLAALERSKHAELARVIYALGLPQIGLVAARELARRHGSLEAFAATEQVDARTREVIAQLRAAGVQPLAPGASPLPAAAPSPDAPKQPLAGKTFVLSGTLPGLTRAEAVALIEAAGGRVAGSVSRNTHYLVAGAAPGAKLEQAHALHVPVIDESGLRRLLAP